MNDYRAIFNRRGHHYTDAVKRHAAARKRERDVLLDFLAARAGETILDAPAGGGYVADGIRALLGDQSKVVCVEPAERFAAAIDPAFEVLVAPLEATPLPDASCDAVASLAGLHHFSDKLPVYLEWFRLLKGGGRVVVADVEAETPPARFLNVYVHRHTPDGHEGFFLRPGDLTRDLERVGFERVEEQHVAVPWIFPDELHMAEFCHSLFCLTGTTPAAVADELSRWIDLERIPDGIQMNWSLRYAIARRPFHD